MAESSPIHVHTLEGCRPTPLAHYLKALGILRLVAEQKDPAVRGWWQDDVFHLATDLDRDELEAFFLDEYAPTPILSPWLKGSGFYKANDPGLFPVEQSQVPRFDAFRVGIAECRKLLQAITHADSVVRAIKARTKRDRTFQTQVQRDLLSGCSVFLSVTESLSDKCHQLAQLIHVADDSDALSATLLSVKRELEKENMTASRKLDKLNEELETINCLVSCPVTDANADADNRPTKAQAEKLKASDGYKNILRLADVAFADLKSNLIVDCKRTWRGPLANWFSAAAVISDDETAEWPALLGTGGNDGNLDFTNNSMQLLGVLFDLTSIDGRAFQLARPLVQLAMFNEPRPDLERGTMGQFFPSAAGGPNCGTGFEGGIGVNPWDYVLMLEGAILFRSGVARRCQSQRLPQAAAPFAVRGVGAGYGSSDSADEGARGEQWMPLWNQPSRVAEVVSLFREGRSQIDGKSAERGSDMARSIARMGVARGINRFERYGYIERNGLSNLAVPLGSFHVTPRPNQDLLAEIMPWVDQLRGIASDKNAPESFDRAHRACEEAVFNCTRGGHGNRFLPLLITLGKAEDQFLKSPRFSAEKYARPIPTLSERWLDVIREEENSVELRLAIALASQRGKLEANKRPQSVRIHWLPLDGSYFAKGENGLNMGPDQSSSGMDLQRALISLMHRRLLAYKRGAGWSKREKWNFVPLQIRDDCGARANDIQAFIEHRVADSKILAVARGLMSVKFTSPQTTSVTAKAREPLGGLAMYGLLRLVMPVASIWLPDQTDKKVRCNPTTFYRLKNGNLGGAVAVATRQLTAAGLRPKLRIGVGSPQLARRLAASMAFGISSAMTTRLALGLTHPELGGDQLRKLEAASDA